MSTEHAQFTHESFQQFLSEQRLMGTRSASSGRLYIPPRPMCPVTYEQDMSWEQLSGRGKLVAYSVVHIVPTAMAAAGYSRHAPYCVGLVKLDEGPMLSGQILGVDVAKPENIKLETTVEARFIQSGDGEAEGKGNGEMNSIRLAFEVVT